jgi:NADH-quinone oxidoreductase subunit H
MKFGMFFMGEFVEVVSLAALASVIFLGGWDVPFLHRSGFEFSLPFVAASYSVPIVHWLVVVIQFVVFLFKIIVLIWFQLMIRWSLPRFRYDQLMSLCWKGLLPISLLNILVVGAFILSGWLDGWQSHQEARTNRRRTGVSPRDRQRPRVCDGPLLQEHFRAAGQEGHRHG